MPATRPLLTFAIPVFNMENYIQAAVESAFSQTYSPLQIILSDDHSSDRTFEIMRALVLAYRGPHQVILNKNQSNLGLAGQWNQIMELARGEFIISAGGDDISLPNRTEIIWREWKKSSRKTLAIQSASIDIDADGNELGEKVDRTVASCHDPRWDEEHSILNYVKTLTPQVVGCAYAFSPILFSRFGPLPQKLIHEDNVLTLRALCLGSITFINTPLVKRRFHSHNNYSRCSSIVATQEAVIEQEERVSRDAEHRKEMYQVFLSDMHKAWTIGLIKNELWLEIELACLRKLRLLSHQSEFVDAGFWKKIEILIASRRDEAEQRLIQWMIPRLLPRDWFRRLKTTGNSARLAYTLLKQ